MGVILKPEETGALTRYDFRRPARMTSRARERVQTCETQRAELLTRELSASVGSCAIRLREAKEAPVEDVCAADVDPLFQLPEFVPAGLVLCAFSAQLAQAWTEGLLGGSGTMREVEREVTDIEVELLRIPAARVAVTLGCDESAHGALDVRYLDPVARRNIDGRGGVLAVFECALGEATAEVRVFMGYDDYAVANGIGAARNADVDVSEKLNVEHVRGLPLELTARMPAQPIRVSDVANLRIGDILHLDRHIEDEIELRAGERPLFMGSPGCVGRSVGVRITKVL